MPLVRDKTPVFLKPYLAHGIDLAWSDSSSNATGECPFCGKEGKFAVRIDTGQARCLVCAEGTPKGGLNSMVFIRKLHEQSMGATSDEDYAELAEQRKLLSPDTLKAWGVCKSTITGDWLVPAHDVYGKLSQLCRYTEINGKRLLLSTPGLPQQLFGHTAEMYDPTKPEVCVCEGPWDAMALWEVIREVKYDQGKASITGSYTSSLHSTTNVLGVPGCNTFNDPWTSLFEGKLVYLLYDSDHPKPQPGGKVVPPPGYSGAKRVANLMPTSTEVYILKWGPEGYDPELPSGTDVRDVLGVGKTIEDRVKPLEQLLAKVVPAKEDTGSVRSMVNETGCTPCDQWDKMILSWRKALRWTEGLDRALSVMLASIMSTKVLGDQLWVKIIGPASCLDGATPVYDPTTGTSETVESRWCKGNKFSVYTLKGHTIGVSQALPPQRHGPEPMYQVTFSSGKQIRVTGGHRFWNGDSYVALHTIADELPLCGAYPLPTISESALLARTPSGLRCSQTVAGCLCGYCACSKYTHPLPARPSSYQMRHHVELPLSVFSSLGQKVSDTSSRYSYWSSFWKRTQQPSNLAYSNLASAVSCTWTKEQISLLRSPRPDTWQPELLQFSDGRHTPKSSDQPHIDPLAAADALETSRAEQLGETLRQLASDTSVQSVYQSSSERLSRLGYYQPRKEQQPLDDEQKTKQQPYTTSVRVNNINLGSCILPDTDAIVNIEYLGERYYYDFHVPETQNYWAEGFFHHNCGKSTLCEAVSINKKYVVAKSTIRGFHSGFKSDKDGEEDNALVARLYDKTLVTKDGDTLLQAPNLSQILSEARDLYDSTSRTHYRNKMSKDYQGVRMTWILCGTSSLRQIDSSELGERFLDCVIMEGIDEDLEDEILTRVANRADQILSYESDGKQDTQHDPDLLTAMQLTGGYVSYLRENAKLLLGAVKMGEQALHRCKQLGKFVAYMRARPSKKQDENAEREFAARLVSQHVRLSKCLAAVLNRTEVDAEVLRRTTKVALDTARGRTLEIARWLYKAGESGVDVRTLAYYTGQSEDSERVLLRFLRRIRATETFTTQLKGLSAKPRWRLTPRMVRLWEEVAGA